MHRARADSKPQRITRLRLEQIRTDAGTQSRAAINDEVVADYAEGMIAGHRFPPIVVFHHKGDYILADGFHRLRGDWRDSKRSRRRSIRGLAWTP
jgi:hypothetical protein